MRDAQVRPDKFKEAATSARIVSIGVSMVFRDRPRQGLAAQDGDRRRAACWGVKARGAPRQEIDGVHYSSKGGAQVLGIHAGVGAHERNGD